MSRPLATAALLGVTAVWGWTFVVVHEAVAVYGVLAFLAARFGLAAAAAGALWGRRLDRRSLRTGAGIGLVLAMGYLFQTWGLRHTTPTNSGLITGLFVVFAPVFDRVLYGTQMLRLRWLAVGLSLVGMVLLTGRMPSNLAIGDLLTLVCAVWLGLHTALLSRHAPDQDPRALALPVSPCAHLLALAGTAAPPRDLVRDRGHRARRVVSRLRR
jgi:drug/metabolite transporter (DMT)-like permease